MSAQLEAVAEQIFDEVVEVVVALGAIVGSSSAPTIERAWSRGRARTLALALLSADDDESAQAAIDLACVLFPGRCDPDTEWWRSPLGQAVARSIGHPTAESVTQAVAAAMLGLHPQGIGRLVKVGKLDRHPDGHVLASSVRHYAATRRPWNRRPPQ